MHFYPHNIKRFNNATRHLTRVERSVYRDSIELYYDDEQPLNGDFDALARVLLVRSDEEKEALKSVLGEFFHLDNGEYRHLHCDEIIAAYRANTSAKTRAGKASAESRRKKKEAAEAKGKEQNLTGVERVLNTRTTHEQQNNKQEPVTSNKKIKEINTCSLISELPTPFEIFYSAYPRKQGKIAAGKAFKRLSPNQDLVQQIVKDIDGRISAGAWDLNEKQFIPLPATYLNGQGWTDDVIPRTTAPKIIDYSAMARKAEELSF